MTDIPPLITVPGEAIDIFPAMTASPWNTSWWARSIITNIPETSLGWLVAQGWQVVKATRTAPTAPTYYTLARDSMQSWMILASLLNEYVNAYNSANFANTNRYKNVVDLWNNTIGATREQLDVQGDQSDAHLTAYMGHLDELVTDVKSEMDLAKASATAAGDIVTAQLASYLTLLNTLEGIYDTHEAVAEAFLTGLGTTELARINEQFDNLLARTRQDLVNRGLYSSAVYTQMQVRIERERNEAIAKLNDQLNREKLDNEHKLYEQEMQVKGMVLDGKLKNAAMQHQQGQFLVDVRAKCALTVMQSRIQRAQGRMEVRDKENALMAYQLDTRNDLIVGLFGFMERREDVGPKIEDMTRLIVGLGDSGGGWLSPD